MLAEIDRSLKAHELIKVRVYGIERDDREALMADICARLNAAPVQHIGNILVIFREKPAEQNPVQKTAAKKEARTKPRAKTASAKPALARRRTSA